MEDAELEDKKIDKFLQRSFRATTARIMIADAELRAEMYQDLPETVSGGSEHFQSYLCEQGFYPPREV